MKKMFAIIKKDTILRFASLSEWLFFLILPVVFTVILAGGTRSGDQDNRIRLYVVDQAGTLLSADLAAALELSTAVRPVLMELEEAESQLEQRQVSAVLVIPPGFGLEALKQGRATLELYQLPNNLDALAAERALQMAVQRTSSAVEIALAAVEQAEVLQPFETMQARQVYFEQVLEKSQEALEEAPDRLAMTQAETADPIEYDPATNSSAGQLITWVFIPLIALCGSFAYERQKGTLRRILTTPTHRAMYLLSTITGQVLIALVQMALLVAFGILVMKVNWGNDLAGLLVIMLAFAISAAAFGTTLGVFVKTESQAGGLSIMLGMVMALLGGCWYPMELFPEFVRTAVKVLPTTWAMQGMLDLAMRGQGLVQILPEAGVLLGFAVVFFIIGIRFFRYE